MPALPLRNKQSSLDMTNEAVPHSRKTASVYQMDFKSTSRRDDMIALLYLTVYLLNNGVPWRKNPEGWKREPAKWC